MLETIPRCNARTHCKYLSQFTRVPHGTHVRLMSRFSDFEMPGVHLLRGLPELDSAEIAIRDEWRVADGGSSSMIVIL